LTLDCPSDDRRQEVQVKRELTGRPEDLQNHTN
jgi:hypothetical protein